MRWPSPGASPSAPSDDGKHPSRHSPTWAELANPSNWSWHAFSEPGTLLPAVAFTVTTVSALRIYKSYLRRIPSVNHIKPDLYRRRTLFGKVTSVGDADNFRLFHTPGGRWAGWGWLPWKRVPTTKEGLMRKTIHIRLAGVDAPELAHWGREAQPHSQEALSWLTSYILHRRVRAVIFKRDQYDRVVAQVFVRKWLLKKDVGLEMLKAGYASVYEAKAGGEYGDFEAKYREAEERARAQKVGMWAGPGLLDRLRGESKKVVESPREYKNRHKEAEKAKKAA